MTTNPYKPSALFVGTLANCADPDQTPHNAASDQGLHCLHTEYSNPYKPSALFVGTLANCADPDQTPHNAASDQGLHCLHTECSIKI